MTDMQHLLDFAIAMAKDAGIVMQRYYNDPEKGVQTKTDKSPVTEADTQINQLLISRVNDNFPDHGVLGEEASTATEKHSKVWVCDPIDGTAPFIIGLPTAMFSLAYVENGTPVVAVTYDPFLDRLFTAVKGKGAYCNGMRIAVQPHELEGSYVAGPSYIGGVMASHSLYKGLSDKGARIPIFPGNVYKCCLLAEGRLHGRIFSGPGAHDIAAVKLIVEEAGGKVTDLNGNEQRYDRPILGAIISNGTIHDDLLEAVSEIGGAEKFMKLQTIS